MGVGEIEKPYHVRCPLLMSGSVPGCSVYHDPARKPGTCSFWKCGWLHGILPEEWKPDRIGFVVDLNYSDGFTKEGIPFTIPSMGLRMNEEGSDAWKQENVLPELIRLSQSILIGVGWGKFVYASIWQGQVFELTRGQQEELNREGFIELMPGFVFTHDPEKKW